MNVSPEFVLAAVTAIVGAAVGWGAKAANQRGHGSQLRALWEWRDSHTVESGNFRAQFERDLGLIRERLARRETQNDEVLRRLDTIDSSIRTLAERRHSGKTD